jgi:hypothetical protein
VPALREIVALHTHSRSALSRKVKVELEGIDALGTTTAFFLLDRVDSSKPLEMTVDALKFKQILHNLVCRLFVCVLVDN